MALAKTADQIFGTSFHITDGDVLLENSRYIKTSCFQARWIDEVVEIQGCKNLSDTLVIPSTIEETPVGRIGKEAFQLQKIKKLILSETLYNIGFAAFYKCEQLESIEFHSGLKVLERSSFNGCSSLRQLQLPDGLIDIGERCFYNCKALKQISVPSSVGHIAEDAFYGCTDLTILCHKGSYAHTYAENQNIKVKLNEGE